MNFPIVVRLEEDYSGDEGLALDDSLDA